MNDTHVVKIPAPQPITDANQCTMMVSDGFAHLQRMGQLIMKSQMIPKHFQNNLADCVIVLEMSQRLDINPILLFQKIYVIKGKPALEAQLMIALFNRSKRFSPLRLKLCGSGDKRTCTAYSTELAHRIELEGAPVTIEMAKKNGWYEKKNSKGQKTFSMWQKLPELMLRYRAASFFIKLHAPEIAMGMSTPQELEDHLDDFPDDEVIDAEKTQAVSHMKIPEVLKPPETGIIPENEDLSANGDPFTDEEKVKIMEQEAQAPF